MLFWRRRKRNPDAEFLLEPVPEVAPEASPAPVETVAAAVVVSGPPPREPDPEDPRIVAARHYEEAVRNHNAMLEQERRRPI